MRHAIALPEAQQDIEDATTRADEEERRLEELKTVLAQAEKKHRKNKVGTTPAR